MAIQGMQSQAVMVVASASENPSGSWATGTKKYHILDKDFALVSTKKSNPKQLAGQPFAVLPWRGMEESAAQLGILPIPQGNGMGEALVRFFGADDCDQYGSTDAYLHHFTWENLPKTATYWISYGEGRYEKVRMVAEDTLDIEIKATGELAISSALKGGELIDSSLADYGTESLADLSAALQLTGMGARLEFGQPGAGVRTAFEAMKLSLKRNITMSLPGKDGQHPSGSGSPKACSSKNSNAALTIDFIDTNGEELKRWRQGVNTAPTATGQNDSAGLVKGRISIFGPAIDDGINGEADYVNGGTLAATWGGTYSAGSVVTVGEIETEHAPYSYVSAVVTNGHMFFRAKTSGVTIHIDVPAGAGESLACNVVSKAVTVTTATGEAGIGTSTAQEIVDIINATPEAYALMDAGVAEGSTGAGVILADVTAQSLASGSVDIFRYRYTTGSGFGAWSGWRYITKAAQTLVNGITVTFDDDDTCVDGDMFYFCSHYRDCLRLNLTNMSIDAFTDKVADGVYKGHMEISHTSAAYANRPTCDLICTDVAAYA
ncbi:Uncharacterised protein [uncultured archaeon]|nr:Uncharacterised protein [uncultured archaeon]